MEKIEIVGVAENIFTHRGFSEKGCYASVCADNCCRRGCDVDKETYELIMLHRDEIEKIRGLSIEQCFEKQWSGQADFLGRDSISSTVVGGTCAFHISSGKGCALWQMVFKYNCSRRIIPSTCRLYPLTWDKGLLRLVDDIEKECDCLNPCNCAALNLWETQKEAIEDIFIINPSGNC